MNKNILETIMGAVILAVAVVFFVFAYRGSGVGMGTGYGYSIKAKFANATGISVGSDVRVGGIKVGTVSNLLLDSKTYEAILKLSIDEQTKLPEDSSAAIVSSGLLGDKFIQVSPGGAEEMLKTDGIIEYTQSSVSLEELIGKFVFSGGGVDSEEPESHGEEIAPTSDESL